MKFKKYFCLLLLEIVFVPNAMSYDYYECPSMDYYIPNVVIEKYCKATSLDAYFPTSKYTQEQYNFLKEQCNMCIKLFTKAKKEYNEGFCKPMQKSVYVDKNGVECTVYTSSHGRREVCSEPNEKMMNRMNEAKKLFNLEK